MDSFVVEIEEANSQVPTDNSSGEDAICRGESLLRIQVPARDLLVDWMLSEAKIEPERAVSKCIIPVLERLFVLPVHTKGKPSDHLVDDAMACLTYELALYAVSCLTEVDSVAALKLLLEHPFPKRRAYPDLMCAGLVGLYHSSRIAEAWNEQQKTRWISPLSQLFKERATHGKISFHKLVEAEALVFLFNVLIEQRWYPSSAVYAERGPPFAWFMKAKAGRAPDRLALITGKPAWDNVRDEFLQKLGLLLEGGGWSVFQWGYDEYLSSMGFGR